METKELLNILSNGEDLQHQFETTITDEHSLASDMTAFCNSKGGHIVVGVNDDGSIAGLSDESVRAINRLVFTASNHVSPAICVLTRNFTFPSGKVMVITIECGTDKPYTDAAGCIWVKSGTDRRRVTTREEFQRLCQESSLVHADEMPVHGSSVSDIDKDFFDHFFEKTYKGRVENLGISRIKLLENMNLAKNEKLNVGGTLLFAARPQFRLPVFIVKAVSFPGTDITDETYIDSQDIGGKLSDVFQKSMNFALSNVHHVQGDQSVNSLGIPEIPKIVFEELIANALLHRDYFISAPIRLLVFADRIEIISPGHLPNNLTIENIKMGNSNVRNPILSSFAPKLLPYRGLGSGIRRALKAYPHIDFVDDRFNNLFIATIRRT